MDNVIAGINEGELNALSIEVLDYRDRISEIFEKIDARIDRLRAVYQGPPCDRIVNYYNAIRPTFAIIKDNLRSYSDDLTTLIDKMSENEKYLALLFDDLSGQIEQKNQNNTFKL